MTEKTRRAWFFETIASLPGGWDLAHAIRLGIKPFAELGANSEALSGSQVDSPCSCRAIFESAPVTMLQSRFLWGILATSAEVGLGRDDNDRDVATHRRMKDRLRSGASIAPGKLRRHPELLGRRGQHRD